MQFYSLDQVKEALGAPALIDALEAAFAADGTAAPTYEAPMRAHHVVPGKGGEATHLLLMPSWQSGREIGIKLVGVNAANPSRAEDPQPMVQGIYMLMHAQTGRPIAQMDAQELTWRRTACASGLASRFLSRSNSTSMGLLGAGAIAWYVFWAHQAVRPIQRLRIWNRSADKAQALAARIAAEFGIDAAAVTSPRQAIEGHDIVSSCTASMEPLIQGAWLSPGTHVDCLGGFRPNMREADDQVIRRADAIFVDTMDGALSEAGDIMVPIQSGLIAPSDIQADLFALSRGEHSCRQNDQQITFFKSVGTALEDLAAAQLVHRSIQG